MAEQKHISLALGTFDGLHSGHMAVINAAKKSKYPMYALLFDEHPMKAITGKAPAELLCDNVMFRLREQYGIPAVHISFKDIMHLSAEEFFCDVLRDDLSVAELSCGENYTFGEGGKGDITLLKKLCEENGIKLNTVATVMYKNEPVSSTRIRKAIENGDIEDANAMLARPFSYSFPVIHGEHIGHKLGFPTANQHLPEDFVKLRRGVYASAVRIGGRLYPSVTNYGVRPTLEGKKCVSETYIIGFESDIYSKPIEVEFFKFLREEKKFPDLQALREQIGLDAKASEEIFSKHLENS